MHLLVTLALGVIIGLLGWGTDVLGEKALANGLSQTKLWDIADVLLPQVPDILRTFNDVLIFLVIACALLWLPQRWAFVQLWVIIMVLRGLFNIVTIMPILDRCGTLFGVDIVGCHDKIFSGHFATMLLTLLFLHANGLISLPLLLFIAIAYALLILNF